MPDGVVTGGSIKGIRREEMIEAFANGASVNEVRRKFGCAWETANVVEQVEFAKIERRKERACAQAAQIATLAADALKDELMKGKIKGSALVPVYGVAVDKMLALRGEPSLIIDHRHTHRLSDDDIISYAVARSKTAKATVVEPPLIEGNDVNGA